MIFGVNVWPGTDTHPESTRPPFPYRGSLSHGQGVWGGAAVSDLIQLLTKSLSDLGSLIYLIAFLAVFAESVIVIGQFVPGTIFLAFLGFLCYLRIYDFLTMLIVAFLAHYAGEFLNYHLGRSRGSALFKPDSRFLKPSLLEKVGRRFESGGVKILLVGQFIGMIRPVVGFVAGMTHYPLRKYLLISALADFLWALLHLGIGYLFGASWQKATHYVEGIGVVLVLVILIFWFSGWLVRVLMAHTGEMGRFIELASLRIQRTALYTHLATRHPGLFAFLQGRLSLTRPWGFPATVGWIVGAVFIMNFLRLLRDIRISPAVRELDLSLLNLSAQLRAPLADRLFVFVNTLGSSPVIWTVVLLVGLATLRLRQLKSFVVMGTSVLLALALSHYLRATNLAMRPEEMMALGRAQEVTPHGPHFAVCVTMFCALAYWLWGHARRLGLRALLTFAVVSAIFLVGLSRLYLGQHFPSDIMAGLSLGLACIVLVGNVAHNIRFLAESDRRADYYALGCFVAGALAAGVAVHKHPQAPPPRIIQSDGTVMVRSLAEMIGGLPRQAHNLAGEPMVPVNLIIIGDPGGLTEYLKTKGWTPVRPDNFFSGQIRAPIFPGFVEGLPAQLTMQRKEVGGRLVLRLWPTNRVLQGIRDWVGNVSDEKIERHFWGLTDFRLTPDLDAATDRFAGIVQPGFAPQRVPIRQRGLYRWNHPFFTHGEALLLTMEKMSKGS